jgi:UDP-glucose 4-epimerase
VLVTGGAGAIGSILVEALLARGDEVAVLDSFHDFYPRAQKERNLARARGERGFAGVFEGDIRDMEFVAKTFESFAPRAVVHLAARAGVRPSLEDPVTYTDVNLLGTSVVLNAATRSGVERFVFASSSSVYGERPRGEFTEDLAADRPLAPYGATKRGGELLCYAAQANSPMASPACASSTPTARACARTWRSTSSPCSCWPGDRFRCTATAASNAISRSSRTPSTASCGRSTGRAASRSTTWAGASR